MGLRLISVIVKMILSFPTSFPTYGQWTNGRVLEMWPLYLRDFPISIIRAKFCYFDDR